MRYKEIAERLAEEIIRTRKGGERLPGLRELARAEGVSLITARHVYQHLSAQGLITMQHGAGTFVKGAPGAGPVDLAAIRPPESLLHWMGAHLSVTIEGLLAYDPPQGYAPLREAGREWLGRQGISALPLIMGGSQQAIFLAGLALLKPGDVVAVEDPGYHGANRIFESLGARLLPISYLKEPADLNALTGKGVRLLYSMPQSHIPTGASMPPAVRGALLELAQREGFYILEDDPLSDVVGVLPLKSMDRAGRVIYVKSLSNILGPGLRIAFCVAPGALEGAMVRLKEINDLSLSGLLQRMVCGMISSGDIFRHIARLKDELDARHALIAERLGWQSPGPCLWIDTRSPSRIHMDSLLHQGIRITPGDVYGPRWAQHIRLSLLGAGREDLMRALEQVRAYLMQEGPGLIRLR